MSEQFAAILLAGGEARRMNHCDKGLLMFREKALVLHVLQRLQRQLDNIVIIANRNIDQYQRFGAPVISDWDSDWDNVDATAERLDHYQGPLRGIYRGLRFLQSTSPQPQWLLLAPCDAPNYPSDLLSRYKLAMQHISPSVQCLVPFDGTRIQPLYALVRSDVIHSIAHALDQKQYSVMHWLKSIECVELPMPADDFHNINYPDQIAK